MKQQDNTIQALNENLSLVLEEAVEEQNSLQDDLDSQKSVVAFMMNVLTATEDVMTAKDLMIAVQAARLEESRDWQTRKHARGMSDNVDVLQTPRDKVIELLDVITNEEAITASFKDLEAKNPLNTDCDVPAYLATITGIIKNQEEEITKLKLFIKGERNLATYSSSKEGTEPQQAGDVKTTTTNWSLVSTCQSLVSKQSSSLALVRSLMPSSLRFGEDPGGRLVSASQCQCLPEVGENTTVTVTLRRRGEEVVSEWSEWSYTNCYQVRRLDNTSLECGEGGGRVRRKGGDLKEEWREEVEEVECPQCPEYGRWSGCSDGEKTMTTLRVGGSRLEEVAERKKCTSGTISVPTNGCAHYSPNMNERFPVEVAQGSRIMFTFLREIQAEAGYDYVGIVDGDGSMILENMSSGRPHPVFSRSNKAVVTFISDGGQENTGFSLEWREVGAAPAPASSHQPQSLSEPRNPGRLSNQSALPPILRVGMRPVEHGY